MKSTEPIIFYFGMLLIINSVVSCKHTLYDLWSFKLANVICPIQQSMWALEKCVFCYCEIADSLNVNWLIVLFRSILSLVVFCLLGLPITKKKKYSKIYSYNSGSICVSFQFCFSFIFWYSVVRYIEILDFLGELTLLLLFYALPYLW